MVRMCFVGFEFSSDSQSQVTIENEQKDAAFDSMPTTTHWEKTFKQRVSNIQVVSWKAWTDWQGLLQRQPPTGAEEVRHGEVRLTCNE